jgi:hypothetical protein
MKANVDFLGNANNGQGEVANMLLTQGKLDPGRMKPYIGQDGRTYITVFKGGDRTKIKNYQAIPIQGNATLRRDEWIQLDEAVLKISETRLNGIQDLIDNNLVFNLGNAMGTTVLEHHTISDAMEAALTMDGITRSKGDRVNYETAYLPLPIIHVDYQINARVLAASRNVGNALDTDNAERAARKVSAKLEEMLFTDTSYTYGGGTIYSYLNEPNRNQVTLVTAWDASAKTGAQIVTEVLSLIQAAIDAKHYGPYALYIPTGYSTIVEEDYDPTTPGTTIRERILKIDGLNSLKVVDTLPDDNIVLVQMTTDVVRLVRGLGIQNVQWSEEGNMVTNYKVMTIQVPQVRADQSGNSGIVHLA